MNTTVSLMVEDRLPMNNSPVVVVTGSSSGIGKATAIKFAQHHYRISLSGRNEDALAEVVKECEVAGAQAVTTTIGDLRDSSVARDLVEHTIKEFGQLDVLVNSAGILVTGSVEECDMKNYDKVFDVNVRSVIQLTKFAIPHIIKQQGAIVNVSSVAGPRPFADVAFYCMSKAALDQFTKCLSLELAPHNVRVNSVNPGVIVSNIHKRAGMNDAEYKEFLEKGKRTHALGRVGTSDEVANGIYFLASKESSFTTGHLLFQDGGRNLMTPR